ncbi:hypothetical protein Nmel_000043 [Mimus melanotis]
MPSSWLLVLAVLGGGLRPPRPGAPRLHPGAGPGCGFLQPAPRGAERLQAAQRGARARPGRGAELAAGTQLHHDGDGLRRQRPQRPRGL